MAKTKSKVFYIGRDKMGWKSYVVGKKMMRMEEDGFFRFHARSFCADLFHELSGIRLRPGQKVKAKLIIVN